MSPFSGQMTTESFDANAAISLGDLYLIIGSPCTGASAEIDHSSGRHVSGLRSFF